MRFIWFTLIVNRAVSELFFYVLPIPSCFCVCCRDTVLDQHNLTSRFEIKDDGFTSVSEIEVCSGAYVNGSYANSCYGSDLDFDGNQNWNVKRTL